MGRKISREENFAGGNFREIPFAVDIIFAGGKFRAKSEFANIAKISSTRKIGVIQYLIQAMFCRDRVTSIDGRGKDQAMAEHFGLSIENSVTLSINHHHVHTQSHTHHAHTQS